MTDRCSNHRDRLETFTVTVERVAHIRETFTVAAGTIEEARVFYLDVEPVVAVLAPVHEYPETAFVEYAS